MTIKYLFLATAVLCGMATVAQTKIEVKELRPLKFTDDSVKVRVIAGAESGSTAAICGKDVHVYGTGLFGADVTVARGSNIDISATRNGKTAKQRLQAPTEEPAAKPHPAADAMIDTTFTVITLPGAYLQYGNGTDRLGGSKMGFIDPDIPLKVVGDYANLYRVQLAHNSFAYIQKEYVAPAPDAVVKTVNSSTISSSDQGKFDRVSISLPCRLPYYSWTQLDPTTICVDIFGAMCNSNWIIQRSELGMVDYVDFRQVQSDVLQVIIKLKKKYAWGYEVSYRGNSLTVDVKHTPSLNLKDLTIGLDAGHGGSSLGAVGNTGLTEAVINLKLVQLVKQELEARGTRVVLSREENVDVAMVQRKQVFKDAGVDMMLAIHNNSGGSPFEEQGSSTYYKHIANRYLAATMLKHLVGCGHKNAGLTGNFNFSLNMPTEYPNALLEVLYMSSLPDEEKLCNPDHQLRIARAIVAGLEEYLDAVKQAE